MALAGSAERRVSSQPSGKSLFSSTSAFHIAARLGAHRRPPARGGLAFPRAPFLRSLLVAWQAVRVALDGRCIPFLQRVAGCLDDLTVDQLDVDRSDREFDQIDPHRREFSGAFAQQRRPLCHIPPSRWVEQEIRLGEDVDPCLIVIRIVGTDFVTIG
jgi:hypothetical protein